MSETAAVVSLARIGCRTVQRAFTMVEINRVLLATGGGPSHHAALARATLLVKAAGAGELAVALFTLDGARSRARTDQITDSVRTFAAAARLEVRIRRIGRNAPGEIAAQAAREEHDIVVVAAGSQGEPTLSAAELLASCPCAVWFVRPLERVPANGILAAIDIAEEPRRSALNLRVLEFTALVGRIDRCEVHLVSAWSLLGDRVLRTGSSVMRAAARAVVRRTREEHRRALGALSAPVLGDLPYRLHVRKGAPERVVARLAAKQQVDLAIAGYHRRTGVSGRLIGTTVRQILDDVTCSVVAVKLDGRPLPGSPRP